MRFEYLGGQQIRTGRIPLKSVLGGRKKTDGRRSVEAGL